VHDASTVELGDRPVEGADSKATPTTRGGRTDRMGERDGGVDADELDGRVAEEDPALVSWPAPPGGQACGRLKSFVKNRCSRTGSRARIRT